MLLELKPLIDDAALASLYSDPYIARVGHDHRAAAPIHHPCASYLGAHVEGRLVGAFLVIDSGFIERDVHALLRREALPHSRALGRLCLDRVFSDPYIARATAYIIEGLETAKNYCLMLGFEYEGKRRAACMKDGQLLGVHILGMTRADWEKTQ